MDFKTSSTKWRPFCLGLNVLTAVLMILEQPAASVSDVQQRALLSPLSNGQYISSHLAYGTQEAGGASMVSIDKQTFWSPADLSLSGLTICHLFTNLIRLKRCLKGWWFCIIHGYLDGLILRILFCWSAFKQLHRGHTIMTSSNGNIFHVTGHLCGEFTGHWWIPSTKASDVELWCFLWSASE